MSKEQQRRPSTQTRLVRCHLTTMAPSPVTGKRVPPEIVATRPRSAPAARNDGDAVVQTATEWSQGLRVWASVWRGDGSGRGDDDGEKAVAEFL